MRWEFEWSLSGHLCEEYVYQKLLKSVYLLQVTVDNVGDVCLMCFSFYRLFRVLRFPQVEQKQTLSEVGMLTVV